MKPARDIEEENAPSQMIDWHIYGNGNIYGFYSSLRGRISATTKETHPSAK